MSIVNWLFNFMGTPNQMNQVYFYYIMAALIALVFIDGIITFLLGSIGSLMYGIKK